MAVIVASGHTRFHFGNCERTAWRRSFFAFAMIRRGLRFDQKPCPVRLSKIQNYLTDNLYVFMLSELKAWVNKKRGGLRTQFQFGNLAAVFRDRHISGGPLPRCQLIASPSRKEREKGRAPVLVWGESMGQSPKGKPNKNVRAQSFLLRRRSAQCVSLIVAPVHVYL